MSIEQREIWFPAKRYGWGWGLPVAWQGWLVFGIYFGLAIVGALLFLRQQQVGSFVVYMILLSLALVVVCWIKGEKPRWRWGGK